MTSDDHQKMLLPFAQSVANLKLIVMMIVDSAAGAAGDLVGAVRRHADIENTGTAADDPLQLILGVEIQPHRNPEAVTQRIGQKPRARRGADQRELG